MTIPSPGLMYTFARHTATMGTKRRCSGWTPSLIAHLLKEVSLLLVWPSLPAIKESYHRVLGGLLWFESVCRLEPDDRRGSGRSPLSPFLVRTWNGHTVRMAWDFLQQG